MIWGIIQTTVLCNYCKGVCALRVIDTHCLLPYNKDASLKKTLRRKETKVIIATDKAVVQLEASQCFVGSRSVAAEIIGVRAVLSISYLRTLLMKIYHWTCLEWELESIFGVQGLSRSPGNGLNGTYFSIEILYVLCSVASPRSFLDGPLSLCPSMASV